MIFGNQAGEVPHHLSGAVGGHSDIATVGRKSLAPDRARDHLKTLGLGVCAFNTEHETYLGLEGAKEPKKALLPE